MPDNNKWRFDRSINLPMVFTVFGALVVVGVFAARVYSDVELLKAESKVHAEQYKALSNALDVTNQIQREDYRSIISKMEKR